MNTSYLHYSEPARCFEEALPIGNGKMGAVVYGGLTEDIICLNHTHLWSGEPHYHKNPGAKAALAGAQKLIREDRLTEAQELLERDFTSHWSESFLALGELKVLLPALDKRHYRRRLDLAAATVEITQGKEGDALQRRYFASHPDEVIVLSYQLKKKNDLEVLFTSPLRGSCTTEGSLLLYHGRCPYLQHPRYYTEHEGKSHYYDPQRGIPFTFALKAETDGKLVECSHRLIVENATYLELYLTCRTGFYSFDALPNAEHERAAKEQVLSAATQGVETLHRRHVTDFASLYGRVELSLDTLEEPPFTDLLLQKPHLPTLTKLLFDYGRYLLISCSRSESAAANLQGIWNEHRFAPWCANYTVNINTEMNYWPAGICNLSECAEPLLQLVEALRIHGAETAKEFYGAPGFVCHHNSDLWAHTEPVGMGEAGSAIFAFWPMASGWFACQLYDLYQYAPNEALLKERIDPILRDAARFYLHLLSENREGKLVLSPSTSPENCFRLPDGSTASVAGWAAMSQQIVKQLFLHCLEVEELLHTEPELAEQLRAALPRLQETKIAPDGSVCEWDRDYIQVDPHHRHLSHLWGLYPGELFREDPVLTEACRKTLQLRGDEGTGWSLGWKINLFAQLGDGDHAMRLIANQLTPCAPSEKTNMHRGGTYPNLMDAHPPFQIDGNFGAVSGIASLFLQSHGDKLHLLPALPSLLKNGKITGLRAKGGVICDLQWQDGVLTQAVLRSPISQSLTLVTPEGNQRITLKGDTPYFYNKGN